MTGIHCCGAGVEMATRTAVLVVGLSAWSTAGAQDASDVAHKHSRPSAAERSRALKEIEAVFDFSGAQTDAARLRLVLEIMRVALDSQKTPVAQYVMFERAMEIATGLGNQPLADRIVGEIDSRFDVDVLVIRVANLQRMLKARIPVTEKRRLLQTCLPIIDALLADDRLELADEVSDDFMVIARRAREGELVKTLVRRRKDIADLARAKEEIETALETLKADPTDAAANLVAGKYYCFTKGNWVRGLPMLGLCGDASLSEMAVRDMKGAEAGRDQLALGDAWWQLAVTGRGEALRARGGYWYKQALASGITGLYRVQAEKRYQEVAKLVDAMSIGGAPPPAPAETPVADAGLILHYTLDAFESGGKLIDASGRGHHGQVVGMPRVIEGGKVGSALEFKRGDYISMPALGTYRTFSIAIWMRHMQQRNQEFSSLLHNNGDWMQQSVHVHIGQTGFVKLGISGTIISGTSSSGLEGHRSDLGTASRAQPGVWNHYVIVYDATDSKGVIYRNAERDVEKSYERVVSAKLGPAQIGAWDGTRRLFVGTMDDVRIYNRALAADEAAALFKLGAAAR